MKAALFAVVSPLQYINALEAVHAFGLKPEQCYLALGVSRKLPATARQVESLIDPSLWREIGRVSGFPAPRGRNAAHSEWLALLGAAQYARGANRLISSARSTFGDVGHLFIGDYRPLNFRHFMACAPEAELWLLDDGSVTHQVVRHRRDPESPFLFGGQFPRRNVKSRLREALTGLRYIDPRRVAFFTCYEIAPPPRDGLRRHAYEAFRHRYPHLQSTDEVWFIGSNHPENGFTSLERYIDLVASVRACYGDEKIVYLPHRGESAEKLARIRDLGFELRQLDLPVEIVIGQSGVFPQVIAGVASSAIDNLSVILGDRIQVHVFRVGEGYSTGSKWKHLKDVIDYHERDVLDLSTFVHEHDGARYGSGIGDVRFYRPGPEAGGGYFRGSDGWLRGVHSSRSAIEVGLGQRELILSCPRECRVWHRGDRVILKPREGAGEMRGVIHSADSRGALTLDVDACTVVGPVEGWDVIRDMGRVECAEASEEITGCLIEPEGVNLLLHSRRLDASPWTWRGLHGVGEGSVFPVTMLRSPDAEYEAAFLQQSGNAEDHQVSQAVGDASVGSPLTWSVYARSGGCERLVLSLEQGASRVRVEFDLSEGARSEPAPASDVRGEGCLLAQGTASSCGDWRRYYLTAILPPGPCVAAIGLERLNVRKTEDSRSGVYVWGPQLERGASCLSYVPTQAERVTRSAGKLRLELEEGWTSLFFDCHVGLGQAEVDLALLPSGESLSYESITGKIRLRGSSVVREATLSLQPPGERLAIEVRRTHDRLLVVSAEEVLLESDEPLRQNEFVVRGGPLHVSRLGLRR